MFHQLTSPPFPSGNRFMTFPVDGGTPTPVDPLLGISNLRRWYGTRSLATCGLYQDAACTVPITEEWQLVAGVKDIWTGNIVATQSDENRRPFAFLTADGTWSLLFDGSDDCLDPALTQGGEIHYTFVMRSVTASWNSYWSPIDRSTGGARWGFVNSGNVQWLDPQAVRRNGIDLGGGFDSNPVDAWAAYTVRTANTASAPRAIGQLENSFFGNFECCFFFLNDPGNTAPQVLTVDAYANTIIPTA